MPVILRCHISREVKPDFIVKRNECVVNLSIMHLLRVPVCKIQFCFFDVCHRICDSQLSIMDTSAVVLLHFMALIYTHPCAVHVASRIFLEVSQVQHLFIFCSVNACLYMFLYCCKCNLFFKSFYLPVHCFDVWNWCIRNWVYHWQFL